MSSEWNSVRRTSPCHRTPLLETNLRAEPCEKLCAADASPDGAGGCAASITQEDWLALYDLAEDSMFTLSGGGEEPPSNMHDGRAAAAPIAMKDKLNHAVLLPVLEGGSTTTSWSWRA